MKAVQYKGEKFIIQYAVHFNQQQLIGRVNEREREREGGRESATCVSVRVRILKASLRQIDPFFLSQSFPISFHRLYLILVRGIEEIIS